MHMLALEGGGWWWQIPGATTLENEHMCSCLTVVEDGGGDGERWWRCGSCHHRRPCCHHRRPCCHHRRPCWQQQQQPLLLSLFSLAVAAGCCPCIIAAAATAVVVIGIVVVHTPPFVLFTLKPVAAMLLSEKEKKERSWAHLCARCPCGLLPCLRHSTWLSRRNVWCGVERDTDEVAKFRTEIKIN